MTDGLPVVLSMGEPSGIGPEIAVKAFHLLNGHIGGRALRLIGNAECFERAARQCGLPKIPASAMADTGHHIIAELGKPSPANAAAVTQAISEGVRLVQQGNAAALVTAPIHKSVLTEAGFGFPGHTEYLAALTGREQAVMMLASRGLTPPLRVIPFTIHIPLKAVFAALDTGAIAATGEIVLKALKSDFGIENPRLALAGLNPHAGEDGTIGDEDRDIIAPAARLLESRGYNVIGPLSADTLFHDEARTGYDAVLCMYHDQALIPIKTLAFWTGVNITLGLPIIRTSPDHGTALGIAGKNAANPASMIAAIEEAAEIAGNRGL